MAQTIVRDGVIYRVNGDGTATVIGYQDAPATPEPVSIPLPQTPKSVADIGKTNADITRTVTTTKIDEAKAPGEIAKTSAEGSIAQGKVATAAGVIGEAERAKALAQIAGARSLGGNIRDIQAEYDKGPGATKSFSGLYDYIPSRFSPTNQAFDTAAQSVRGNVKNALGWTGGENNTLGEQRLNMGAYVADTSDFDSTIEAKIARLRRLQNNAFMQAIQTLGGIPDASGRVIPLTEQQAAVVAQYALAGGESPDGRDIITALAGGPPASGSGGGNGSGSGGGGNPGGNGGGGLQLGLSRGESYTTPQDLAILAAVQKAFAAGGDVGALVQAAEGAGGRVTPQDLANFNSAVRARAGGQQVNWNPNASGRRTPAQVLAGNALMSPVGTAAATAISGTGLNAIDALLPDQMQALRSLNQDSATIGDIAGAIGGTTALGKVAESALGKIAPSMASRLLGGGAKAQFARNALGDAVYGTAYGNNVNGDAATGALGGALGSVGGQLGGKALGAVVGGAMRSPAGEYLADRVGDLTIGQQLGGTAKTVEDAAMSIPFIGDMIARRRGESLMGLQRATFKEAADIVGGNVDQVGQQGLDQLGQLRSGAYSRALDGKAFPIDQQGLSDIAQARAGGVNLPPDLQARFDLAMRNRVDPVANAPQMTGEQYQQAMRGLSGYKAEATKPGFEADYRGALTDAQDALRGVVARSGNPETLGQLSMADRLYRAEKIIQEAQGKARKDTLGLGGDIFRPGDLTDAVYNNAKKFNGNVPFEKLAKAAQNVIPSKLPDSGTGYRRALQGGLGAIGLGGALGGGAGAFTGEDALSGGASGSAAGAGTGLGALGLLALGGSRMGQKALQKVLIDRPDTLAATGAKIRKLKGLFGSATVPLLLESGNQ